MEAPVFVTLLAVEAAAPMPTQDRLDLSLLAALCALAVPLLVNLLTKQTASDGLKALVNIVGVSLVSVTALWTNPTGAEINLWTSVNVFLASLAASFVAYKGAYKPLGVAGFIADHTKNFGLSSPPTVQLSEKGAEDVNEVSHSREYDISGGEYALLSDNEQYTLHPEVISTRDEHPEDLVGDEVEDDLDDPDADDTAVEDNTDEEVTR